MQYFNVILERAEPEIATGKISEISVEYVKQVLRDYDLFLTFQNEKVASAAN
jgi:hypothetical protein